MRLLSTEIRGEQRNGTEEQKSRRAEEQKSRTKSREEWNKSCKKDRENGVTKLQERMEEYE